MDLIKIIDDEISKIPDEEHRNYIGASSIGKDCKRAIWYSYKGIKGIPIAPKLRRTFEIGKRLEDMILDYIELAGFKIIRPAKGSKGIPCQDEELEFFKGHMDGLLYMTDSHLISIEIKTANRDEYKKFVTNGLKAWNITYYAQNQSYMGMEKLKNACVFVLNKDNSEWASEWIDFDEIFYDTLKLKAIEIKNADEAPDKINQNPCWWQCQMCKYKEICHKPGEING